jgi:hypothetical protein
MENPASVIQKEEQERPKKGRRSKGKLHHWTASNFYPEPRAPVPSRGET